MHPVLLAGYFGVDRTTILHAVKTARTMVETNHKSYVNSILLWDDIVSDMMPKYIEDYYQNYMSEFRSSVYRTFRNAVMSKALDKASVAELMESIYSELFDGSEELVNNEVE